MRGERSVGFGYNAGDNSLWPTRSSIIDSKWVPVGTGEFGSYLVDGGIVLTRCEGYSCILAGPVAGRWFLFLASGLVH